MLPNTILNSSCLDSGMLVLEDSSINLVLTDPPYGQNYQSGWNNLEKIQNDDDLTFLDEYFRECYRILKNDGCICCFAPSNFELASVFYQYLKKNNFNKIQQIIWCKDTDSGMGDLKSAFAPDHENIFFAVKDNFSFNKEVEKRPPSVLHFKQTAKPQVIGHPTPKPIELLSYLIRVCSNKYDMVFDGFMGSGSTAVAAKMEERNYLGFEINQKYHSDSIKRLEYTTINDDGIRYYRPRNASDKIRKTTKEYLKNKELEEKEVWEQDIWS